MVRRCDRYLLREMLGPFILALAGLVLFILLNIILSLSDLMVDRGIGMLTLLRLVVLKMPSLLVIAVPMSALFATFLGLGRLAHDREIVALESIGIPLRRILLPLIIAAAMIAGADFAIYNWGVPASEHAYQQALRGVIFRQGVPRITANAFFKGADNQFFYVRRYDEEARTLHDVLIYDTTGRLFPHAESRVTIITAETGHWTGAAWELESGRVYGFDLEGPLKYSGSYEHLAIPLEQSVEEVLSRSRTPAEMGIAELLRRIAAAGRTGQRADEYIVEAHLKGALPLATIVFVLLGGALSLVFNPRSRAAGIVLGLLLVGLYQGALWWTQTLGRRGAMNPGLAAWVPDLVFGAFGLLLFLRVDRLAYRDLWSRWRGRISWFAVFLLLTSFSCSGQNNPLDLTCDELFISDDRSEIRATGSVSATLQGTRLSADRLDLTRLDEGEWHVEASGSVHVEIGDDVQLAADALVARLAESDAGVLATRVEAESFVGQTRFVNSIGDEHELFFRVEQGVITFDGAGEVSLIEARRGEITTCNCCDVPLRNQPYTLSATRVLLYPDKLLVGFGLTARIAGTAAFWLPFYVQPLEETLESPLFPAFGNSALRGLFVKWNLPFFLTENLYGSVLIDYFSRLAEVGVGGLLRYTLPEHSGRLSAYYFPAKVGDRRLEFDLKHSIDFGPGWEGIGRLEYESVGEKEELSFAFRLEGAFAGGDLTVAASRETTLTENDVSVTERIPEITVKMNAHRLGSVTLRPQASVGLIREWENGVLAQQRLRLGARAQIIGSAFRIGAFAVAPEATADIALYGNASLGWDRQESASLSLSATWDDLTLTWGSTFVHGASPFAFDRMEAEHRIRWRIERSGRVDVRISGGVDFAEGTEPVDATLSWGAETEWRFEAELDPRTGRFSETVLRGSTTIGACSIAWRIPYNWEDRRFDDARLDFDIDAAHASLSVSPELDLNRASLLTTDIGAELTTDAGWGASFDAVYEPDGARFSSLRYGVFRDIAECVRVGIERDAGEIWIYGSVIAFPEAILRYAPRGSNLDVGG